MIRTPDGEQVAPDGGIHLIETVNAGPSPIEHGSEILCALFLITMIVLIGAEAIARNIFATSLQITDEIGGYLLVALTFLSMSVAEARGAFHRVELIQSRLKRLVQLISQIVFDIISLGASLLVTWQLARVALNSWRSEDVAPTPLQTSLWIPQSVMSIGMALLCFALIRTIYAKARHIRGSAPS
ncbi:TRAP-type C4-dicarboxylate transport system permease small subunit [Nitrobacteraceae bacterium AZCC 1564]